MRMPTPFKLNAVAAVALAAGCGLAQADSNADASFAGFMKAFLVDSNGSTYFRKSVNDGGADGTWVASLDIMVAEDAYETTGRPAYKALVDKLCRTWLQKTPTPWAWDGWNDDIGWFSLGMIRGYQMTGNTDYLNAAKYGFDMAWARGWDTQYNGGGIWEQQPDMTPPGEKVSKEALSNDSLGQVAVMLYQSTHDQAYLDHAIQIHAWVTTHIYDAASGKVETGVDRNNTVDTGSAVYNQGTFVDFSHLLYLVTGDIKYDDDARRSIDYVMNNMTSGGIITNNAGYLNTWADSLARGLGHFARDTRAWKDYLPWMQQNAASIWSNRRTDYDITWNGWNQATPADNTLATSKFDSAVSWLEFTPATLPTKIAGIHVIRNKATGVALDNGGSNMNGAGVIQWERRDGQNQKWLLAQNEDKTWSIHSMSSWNALDIPGGNPAAGVQPVQWPDNHDDNQRWLIKKLADGSYKIVNKATSLALDGGNSSTNGAKLVQSVWNDSDQQHWKLH